MAEDRRMGKAIVVGVVIVLAIGVWRSAASTTLALNGVALSVPHRWDKRPQIHAEEFGRRCESERRRPPDRKGSAAPQP
jgi:hypothetical protein